jgi:hypothetical protein
MRVLDPSDAEANTASKRFAQEWKAKTGITPGYQEAAWTSSFVASEAAVANTGSANSETLTAALNSMYEPSYFGQLNANEKGGNIQKRMFLLQRGSMNQLGIVIPTRVRQSTPCRSGPNATMLRSSVGAHRRVLQQPTTSEICVPNASVYHFLYSFLCRDGHATLNSATDSHAVSLARISLLTHSFIHFILFIQQSQSVAHYPVLRTSTAHTRHRPR